MFKVFKNILSAKFIWKKRLGQPQKPEEEFTYEGPIPGVDVPKYWRCLMLDVADRAAFLLGPKAKQLYVDIAKLAEFIRRSWKDETKPIYEERYVNRTIQHWKDEDKHIEAALGSYNPPSEGFNPGPVPLSTPVPIAEVRD